ncbi:DUF2061 domain-containing protein [Robertkochia sediminum]|uniref:DUF2061 domain-containing protein n=1 Tax=Robertkochia sediminum TaxID=2785326 RepID=UPI0019346B5C|nr:DUF2061 domain-containing protein [Robertkochia sediminum]MBL7473630.1 DUF2061 domain-containing protein [Robertkochia sediminum]
MKLEHRHILKTLSWRVLGTSDTFFLSWLLTGNPLSGMKIGVTEVFSKMILYYMHERVWSKRIRDRVVHRRLFKTLSWRLIGTVDTILIGWIVTSDPLTGLKIGMTEVITKMILYYLHEWVWERSFTVQFHKQQKLLSNKMN